MVRRKDRKGWRWERKKHKCGEMLTIEKSKRVYVRSLYYSCKFSVTLWFLKINFKTNKSKNYFDFAVRSMITRKLTMCQALCYREFLLMWSQRGPPWGSCTWSVLSSRLLGKERRKGHFWQINKGVAVGQRTWYHQCIERHLRGWQDGSWGLTHAIHGKEFSLYCKCVHSQWGICAPNTR